MDEPKPMRELTRIREERGLSQQGLADASGVNKATINQIERGRRSPNLETLEKLAGALAVEMGDFFPKAQAPLPLDGPVGGADDPIGSSRMIRVPTSTAAGMAGAWIQDKTTEELQQIALEEAQFAKPQTYEELLKGHKENKKAQLEEAHRRTMAYANIANINEELGRRGARSPVELAIKQFNDAMSAPEEAPQEPREKQEDQRAG